MTKYRESHSSVPYRLGTLHRGDRAIIVAVSPSAAPHQSLSPHELERRLLEIGFVEGAAVEVLHEAFPKGDPIAVRINEHTVALRRAEADAVLVERRQ
ncbi:MAG: FeoA family protein [Rhodospirillaceae bacterium]